MADGTPASSPVRPQSHPPAPPDPPPGRAGIPPPLADAVSEHRETTPAGHDIVSPRSGPAPDAMGGFEHIRDTGFFYGIMLGIILASFAVAYHSDYSTELGLAFSGALYSAIIFFALKWRSTWFHLIRLPLRDKTVQIATVAVPVMTVGATRLLVTMLDAAGINVPDVCARYINDGYGFPTIFISIAILPPLFEEIAFRGVMLWKLANVMTWKQAVAVSSIFFAILHFDIIGSFVFIIPLACAAAWATRRTSSLLPAMIMHFLHNGAIVLIEWLKR